MELKKQTFLYYQTVLDAVSAPEAGAEMIVPDLYPDMARIVDTAGQACVKETVLRDDRLDLTGLARVGVLYRPEGEDGLRKLDVSIPFNHVFDGRFPPNSEVHCGARLLDIEARAINPRKISVLCRLSLHAVVYAPAELSIPSEVDEPCEVKMQLCDAYMPVAVKSKGFTINEGLELPASRPPVDELVIALPRLEVTDVKIVGSKAVFKGAVLLELLYLSGGEPVSAEHEFSMSQIMDMDGLEDGAAVDLDLRVTGIELDVGGVSGDPRSVNIALHLEAQAVAYMERQMEAIVDLYSTSGHLKPLLEPLHLTALVERGTRRQQAREMLEAEEEIRSVIYARVCLGPITRLESGEPGCEAFVNLLYLTDDGEFRSMGQKVAVPSGIEADGAMLMARQAGQVTAAPSSGGIELRFSVDFSFILTRPERLLAVGGVQEEEPAERPARPSIVLRRCHSGEGLWNIAKRYSTTISELCMANGLEDCAEEAPDGQLLLIPKKR
ncbi:MAG: DUF3794 domain-containing protein [Oscillospiraceae bacterium]|jgi:hypothetical protein|nr:DUF3794 domain-containing protein [Oscillospiraceae bacterium]